MGGSSADSSGSTPPADKGLAPWEAWTALVKGNAGPGLLSLPFAFSLVGPVAGPILVCLVGIVVAHNLSSLVACKQSMHAGSKCISTYGDLARDSLGRRGEIVVEVFQVLVQLSVCSAYFSFVSDNLAQVLPSFPQRVFIVIFFPVMASLCVWLTRMQQLAPVSAVANVILLAGVVCILVIVGRAWGEVGDVQEVKFVVSNIPLFLGQTVYSFGGISLMLPIEVCL
jgi:amino acid permease